MATKANTTAQSDTPPWAAGTEGRHDELNPELNETQIGALMKYGEVRKFAPGDWVWKAGELDTGFHLVLSGQLEVVRHSCSGDEAFISHGRGHYGGETVTMSGGGALVSGRADGDLETLWMSGAKLREMIALEPELGEIILLSFILRRMRMIAENIGDVTLIGTTSEPNCARILSFLSRNGLPYRMVDTTEDSNKAAEYAENFSANLDDCPLLICHGKLLKNPCNREVAECMGFAANLDSEGAYDLAVIGGGPAGLASAVYGASEGLRVVVIESTAPGGQAGTSSKIENYLGFPTGISGQALAGRAFLQAQKFGAVIAIARSVKKLECSEGEHIIRLENDQLLKARSVVIATGAVYRQPNIDDLEKYGSIHYGASHIEGKMCSNQEVAIVGGGNSAGQAAVYLSGRARKVNILIRGESLASSMSDYLIQRINSIDNIELHTHTEVQSIVGDPAMEKLTVLNNKSNQTWDMDATHLFLFIGARPGTDFVEGQIALDERGFIVTGESLTDEQLNQHQWDADRKPYLLETSCPRIFAVGDVRSGSVKRVASAVGEGSVCVQFVHRTLQ